MKSGKHIVTEPHKEEKDSTPEMAFTAGIFVVFAVTVLYFVVFLPEHQRKHGIWKSEKPDTLYVQDAHSRTVVLDWSGTTATEPEILVRNNQDKTFILPSRRFCEYYDVHLGYVKHTPDIKFAHTGDTLIMQREYQKYKGRQINKRVAVKNISLLSRAKQH